MNTLTSQLESTSGNGLDFVFPLQQQVQINTSELSYPFTIDKSFVFLFNFNEILYAGHSNGSGQGYGCCISFD